MKIPRPLLAFFLLGACSASATVTLQFSSATTYATNFANGAGAGGSQLTWGIIIDTAGDGFDFTTGSTYYTGFTLQAGGQALTSGDGQASDDYLYVASITMGLVFPAQNGIDGAVTGQNRITSLANVPYGSSGIGVGDAFAIVWFDQLLGTSRMGAVLDPSFFIPPDANTTPFVSVFAGADPLKQMTYTTPEPSSALLGLLGAASLLRRRR